MSGKRIRAMGLSLLLLLVLLPAGMTDSAGDEPLVRGEELVFSGGELAAGEKNGIVRTSEGVTLMTGDEGTLISPVIIAPLPFSDVGPRWKIDLPAGAGYALEVRTSLDGMTWEDWIEVEAELDWVRPESEMWVGDLVPVPQTDRTHQYVQYRWWLYAAPDGRAPLLQEFHLAFIDGGVTPDMSAPSSSVYPKPSVVSRTGWLCPDGQTSPLWWPPDYQSVTHFVVHHTATPNSDTDFAARVRSIWWYHTDDSGNGWGDIGYNYLVDPNGVLYEGRAGGDDAVGAHAAGHNWGSLGISFIGTYSSDPVPQAMIDSAAELMAWKADEKGIDPHGWGSLAGDWVPRICGHKDVGQTTCPGAVLYGHLPLLRDEVASRLDSVAYTFRDELEAELSESPYWFDGPSGCGYDDHAYWTYSTTSSAVSENWATWRPSLPQAGSYRVYAYVPYCINGHPDSEGVFYRVNHLGGETTVPVNQADAAGGWVDLGVYDFPAGDSGWVFLIDLAQDDNHSVWFDTVKWFYEGSTSGGVLPPENTAPADGSWSTLRDVTFSWSPSPSEGVQGYWMRIATDPDLVHVVKSDYIDTAQSSYLYQFSQDYAELYWGLQTQTADGDSPPSGPWRLGVDSAAPTASVDQVLVFPDGRYWVGWSGYDSTSGLVNYDVDLRYDSDSDWSRWLTGTSYSGSTIVPDCCETVWFRVRAADNAGNVGVFDGGTASTAGAIAVEPRTWLPLVLRAAGSPP